MKKKLFIAFLFFSIGVFAQKKSIQKLSISPNPFYTSTTISFYSTKEQPIKLVIKNILGKTVFEQNVSVYEGLKNINFERGNLKNGMYIYAIQNENEVISKRFVIK